MSLLWSYFVTVIKPKWTLMCFLWADLWCLFLVSKSCVSKSWMFCLLIDKSYMSTFQWEELSCFLWTLVWNNSRGKRYSTIVFLMNDHFFQAMVLIWCSWTIFILIVKLHLQGYSVQSLAYLSRCSIPYNVDEEDYQAKFEKWRVCWLESVILVFFVVLGMI